MDKKEKARILQKGARLVRLKRVLDEIFKDNEIMKGVKAKNEQRNRKDSV